MRISPEAIEAAQDIRMAWWRRALRKPMKLISRLRLASFKFDPEKVAGMDAVADDIRRLAAEADVRRSAVPAIERDIGPRFQGFGKETLAEQMARRLATSRAADVKPEMDLDVETYDGPNPLKM